MSTVPCPNCRGLIPAGATFCELCRVVVRNEGGKLVASHPAIRSGGTLVAVDLRREPPPGQTKRQVDFGGGTQIWPVEHGLMVAVNAGITMPFVQEYLRMRDAVCRLWAAAIDPEVFVGLIVRREFLGTAETQYVMDVCPEKLAVRVARYFSDGKETGFTELMPWTQLACVLPVGQPNVIEFRAQGPSLQGFVNGVPAFVLHDATWGIGRTGFRVGSLSQTPGRRALVTGYEVLAVSA